MYSRLSGLVLGFHGCDKSICDAVLRDGKGLSASRNDYDWLGHGLYFWENSPSRAMEYAVHLRERPLKGRKGIQTPAVVGAVIDLGYCLNLLDYRFPPLLAQAYARLDAAFKMAGQPLPNNACPVDGVPLRRCLDCAVIEMLHTRMVRDGEAPFDSVRAAFREGEPVYPGSAFFCKDHIQLCIRNPKCVKGYFLPRDFRVIPTQPSTSPQLANW